MPASGFVPLHLRVTLPAVLREARQASPTVCSQLSAVPVLRLCA